MPSRQYASQQRKIEAGWRRVPVWFDPEGLARLAALTREGASEQAAIRRAVEMAAREVDGTRDANVIAPLLDLPPNKTGHSSHIASRSGLPPR